MNEGDLSAVYRVFDEIAWGDPSQSLLLGGFPVRVYSADDRSRRLIEDRFGHLIVEMNEVNAQIAIRVCTADLPDLAIGMGVHRLPGGGVVTFEQGQQLQVYRPNIGIDLGVSLAGWNDVELTSYPLATAIASWAVANRLLPVHAAALEFDGRGVLLVGESGAGKSTTAVACALEGAGLLGDDLCLVDAERRKIHSWYGTVKLHDDSAELLGARSWERLGVNPLGKSVVAVSRVGGLRLAQSASLDLVVVLRSQTLKSDAGASLDFASGQALTGTQAVAAVRSTALPVPNGVSAWLRNAAKIAQTVPVVGLVVDRPPNEMAEQIAAMIGAFSD